MARIHKVHDPAIHIGRIQMSQAKSKSFDEVWKYTKDHIPVVLVDILLDPVVNVVAHLRDGMLGHGWDDCRGCGNDRLCVIVVFRLLSPIADGAQLSGYRSCRAISRVGEWYVGVASSVRLVPLPRDESHVDALPFTDLMDWVLWKTRRGISQRETVVYLS